MHYYIKVLVLKYIIIYIILCDTAASSLFAAARIAIDERNILADLDHPQPATVIFCDNEVAIAMYRYRFSGCVGIGIGNLIVPRTNL